MRSRRALAAVIGVAVAVPTVALAQHGAASTTPASPLAGGIAFGFVGRYATGLPGASAETVAIDGTRLYVTNADSASLDVVDVSSPGTPSRLRRVELRPVVGFGPEAAVTSVAVSGSVVAVSIVNDPKTSPGAVVLFDRTRLESASKVVDAIVGTATVGANPDAIVFTPDGKYLLVANEGEPSRYAGVPADDPEGSVSLIKIPPGQRKARGGRTAPLNVRTTTFRAFNHGGPRHAELPAGVRIFGPNASVAQDLEPEYITVSPNGRAAYVTLQENNAMAVLDLPSGRVDRIVALGYQDFGTLPIDASDRDNGINIRTWAGADGATQAYGMLQPDQVASFVAGGRTYLLTANEGDSRTDWPGLNEESRGSAVTPSTFTAAKTLRSSVASS